MYNILKKKKNFNILQLIQTTIKSFFLNTFYKKNSNQDPEEE